MAALRLGCRTSICCANVQNTCTAYWVITSSNRFVPDSKQINSQFSDKPRESDFNACAITLLKIHVFLFNSVRFMVTSRKEWKKMIIFPSFRFHRRKTQALMPTESEKERTRQWGKEVCLTTQTAINIVLFAASSWSSKKFQDISPFSDLEELEEFMLLFLKSSPSTALEKEERRLRLNVILRIALFRVAFGMNSKRKQFLKPDSSNDDFSRLSDSPKFQGKIYSPVIDEDEILFPSLKRTGSFLDTCLTRFKASE